MKKIKIISLLLAIIILGSSCLKRDDLEDVTIYTTVYPIEYITNELYGYNSKIKSIFPDGINVNEYSLTEKQINDYSKGAVFIYNGLSDEKKIAAEFVNRNEDIKIIDVSQGIEIKNSVEELWLSPSNYLMLAQNIKTRLTEYISNKYIHEEIEKNYENIKINISEIDAELKIMVENANNNTIVVSNNLFKFLEKYGYEVISLQNEKEVTTTTLNKIKEMFNNGSLNYVFLLDGEEPNETIVNLQNNNKAKLASIKPMTTLTDEQRNDGATYISIMKENITAIKNELYE